ncbi:hypothetical protein ABDD95_22915 [Mucilaginibacter sp. PAMB04274]|uniref:hypothetical protein n=1 Tax=Mucilaginibacter sp. PAMB04274 TaxID=3138568 RepID=UPI0031F7081D
MSVSYIPKNVYAVCTFQTDNAPRMFVDTRAKISVFYSQGQRTLLTIEDRNINEEFPCKSPKNAMWSFLAFGAGLIVGAFLLSNPVGWVIALGVGSMIVGGYYATQINHKCTGALGNGHWALEHPKVRFNQERAITHNSMLVCDAGGVLSPIFSLDVANRYAQSISDNNAGEIFFNTIASFFGGAGAVLAFSGATAGVVGMAKLGGIAKTIGWMGGTMAFVAAGTYGQREVLRSNLAPGNEHYTRLNEVDANNPVPGYVPNPLGATPGDLGSPDILEVDAKSGWFAKDQEGRTVVVFNGRQYVKDVQGNYREFKESTKLASDLKKIEGIPPRELHKNEIARQITKDIRQGRYNESMVKLSRDGNQVVRPRDLIRVLPDARAVKINSFRTLGQLGVKGGGLIAFVFPFVATRFSEQARAELASAMAEDMNNGINVTCDQ